MNTPVPSVPGSPRRPGRPRRPEDANVTGAIAAAREALGKKRPAGSRDVTAGDVEFAAMALVQAGAQPHPRLILRITGGSLSTVSRLFAEWFASFAQRSVDPGDPRLDLPTKVTLRLQLLVANLVSAAREQLLGLKRPEEVFQAAAELGERQAMREQIAALKKDRDHFRETLNELTASVGNFRAAMEERLRTQATERAAIDQAAANARRELDQLREQLAEGMGLSTSRLLLRRLRDEIRQLRTPTSPSRARPSTAKRPKAQSRKRALGSRGSNRRAGRHTHSKSGLRRKVPR